MKKILLLGGARYLISVIETIHRLGYYAITCDYLPDNIAHKYSDEYYNVSIIDKEKVLELACNLKIDGIMSFACDPGVVTAAYVAEKMKLPFQCSYESARILQDKGEFRKFLQINGFNCPHARSYDDIEKALLDRDYFSWPVIVKPVDSAGSKGVTRVDNPEKLRDAIQTALSESLGGNFIIEDFITFEGYHSSADDFTVNGELVFCTYSDHLFDEDADNPYIPAFNIWPSTMRQEYQEYLTMETRRLMKLLGVKTGIYNIETCVGDGGKPYIMEVSPRGGGCKIADILYLATGTNLVEAEVKKAVGDEIGKISVPQFDGVWCEVVIHNRHEEKGIFERLEIEPQIKEKYIKLIDMTVKKGDYTEPFTGANKSLGDMFLRFETREELNEIMGRFNEWFKIVLS